MQEVITETSAKKARSLFDLALAARVLATVGGGFAVGWLVGGQIGSFIGTLAGLVAVLLTEKTG
jgi:hypothetical protein